MKPRLAESLLSALRHSPTHAGKSGALPWPDRLRWALRRGLAPLGWPGVLAAGVLAISTAFYFSAIRPAQERLDRAERQIISLHRQAALPGKMQHEKVLTPAEQMAEFYRIFPQERNSPEWLEKLVSVAEGRGISLNEGEYKVTRDQNGRLVRYQITLPLKGEYPQIRRFLTALPSELPAMALVNVQFERKKISDPDVEAKIGLVLFLEQES